MKTRLVLIVGLLVFGGSFNQVAARSEKPNALDKQTESASSPYQVGWRPVEHKESAVSASIPATPRITNDITGSFKYRGEPILSSLNISANYEQTLVMLRIFEARKTERALREFLDTRVNNQRFVRDIMLDERAGKLYEERNETVTSRMRCFATPRYVVVFEVTTRNETNAPNKDDAIANRIFDSFSFDKTASVPKDLPPLKNTVQTSAPDAPETAKNVTRKAVVRFTPEPPYTEIARKNQVQGSVLMRAVFTANGNVINITPIKTLPDGLTENAVAAARLARFIPAVKDGRNVSQYVTLSFSFNMY